MLRYLSLALTSVTETRDLVREHRKESWVAITVLFFKQIVLFFFFLVQKTDKFNKEESKEFFLNKK